ncbi:hypothetical protein [Helicobacter cetorum]|uniref:hypothetical protein n=1 Tax=Helicobacter cetorum TaxID=138563 RepID=UPI001315239D|nr:hypothetical protein [Helicobacter cetorum]
METLARENPDKILEFLEKENDKKRSLISRLFFGLGLPAILIAGALGALYILTH